MLLGLGWWERGSLRTCWLGDPGDSRGWKVVIIPRRAWDCQQAGAVVKFATGVEILWAASGWPPRVLRLASGMPTL